MNKMLLTNMLQKRFLESKKPVNILANGRGSGQTFSLYLKTLTTTKECCTIYGFNYQHVSNMIYDYKMLLQRLDISFVIKGTVDIFRIEFEDDGVVKRVNFRNTYNQSLLDDIKYLRKAENSCIMFDQVESCNRTVVDHYLSLPCSGRELVFTTQPYYCGWRNPKFENGELVYDKWGELIYTEKSWDASLVDWKEGYTKALPEHYKPHVNIITNHSVCDEVLSPEFENQVSKDRYMSGKWISKQLEVK